MKTILFTFLFFTTLQAIEKIGLQVRLVPSGKILYEQNEHEKFIPASTLKLLTLATALHKLGPSYRFETKVYYDGNLYIKGSGDPSFSVHDLDDLAGQIKQLVKKPIKNIIIDDSVFDKNYYGQDWLEEDYDRRFSAPISGINVNYNRLVVGSLPDQKIILDPYTKFIKLRTKKSGDYTITGLGLDIKGKVQKLTAPQYKTYAIKEPIAWAGLLFKEALERIGIKITGVIKAGAVPENLNPITRDFSPYLSEMGINYTKFSNNLGNEALLKTLGAGNFEQGLEVVKKFVDIETLADASGLSRTNLVTPDQMADFLVKTASNFKIAPEFMAALPIGGEDGTLSRSFNKEPFKGNVRAKTGHMSGIRGLAGYYRRPDGKIVAFALFANEIEKNADKLKSWLELILNKL
ncbi:MAG: D-alanyl-D-alanine carboxypeptidase/D-alanyl-D-alanine-endopeptidase [Myxococcaceae bacterium]